MNRLAADVWPLLKGKGGGSVDLVQGKAQELPLDEMKKMIAQSLG